MSEREAAKPITGQTLRRLPYYLNYLRGLQVEEVFEIAASKMAAALQLNEIQVRKDLASISSVPGKPKHGFPVDNLIDDIEHVLGYRNTNDAVLVGAGSLGHALMSFSEFANYGLNIAAAFDVDPAKDGETIAGKPVLSVDKLEPVCRRMDVKIGIITVPARAAQEVCDQLVKSGIRGIWNFAPVKLSVPEGILVQNENMAASLAILSQHLREEVEREKEAPDK